MESIKKLLKNDQFSKIIDDQSVINKFKTDLNLIIGDPYCRFTIKGHSVLIAVSRNIYATKIKQHKLNILKLANNAKPDESFKEILCKVDPHLLPNNKTLKKNISKNAKEVLLNLSKSLSDSPLKQYLLKRK